MTIAQARLKYCATLRKRGVYTAPLDVDVLICHVLGRPMEFIFGHPEFELRSGQARKLAFLISRRSRHMPIAYLTGHKEFFGYDFKVSSDVLVPRPETEMLVEEALNIISSRPSKAWRILEVGAGSGAIMVSLTRKLHEIKLPVAKYSFLATDISASALGVARQNALTHKVTRFIKFKKSDLLTSVAGQFNLIIANLPYVPLKEYRGSPAYQIIKWEPKIAITDSTDGLSLFRKLIEQSRNHLKQGYILLEHGYNQGQKISKIIKSSFPQAQVAIKKDLAGINRTIIAKV
ncbi:peptide chain release factor N(5)-glutamine methyltransferase [Candidatus Uhrbacteria bacterium]|nr:peptide chain release factor N(5)-glutamine methyltransferase [Candidatus Uhrbacteria bacterium]